MSAHKTTNQILIFSGVLGDTRRYRALHLWEQLRLAGQDCVLSHLTDPRLPQLAQSAQVVVLHRVAHDGYVERLLAGIRERGALLLLDADDFLYDPAIMRWIDSPDFQDPIRARLYRQELLRHRQTLEYCHGVLVSTGPLAEMMAPFGKPVRIHRNAYNLEMLQRSEQAYQRRQASPERVVIGFASGTRTHDSDFAMIQPALQRVMARRPEVELWLMGPVELGSVKPLGSVEPLGSVKPVGDWGSLTGRVRRFPLVPWRELPARLAQLDINLAPLLPGSPFNQAKSEIKYMEAALTRVPTVATPTDAFQFAIRDGETGRLAETVEEWEAALEELADSPERRRQMGEAAYQDVLARYSPQSRGESACQILTELAAQTGKQLCLNRIPTAPTLLPLLLPEHEAHPTNRERAAYSIRNRGLPTLLGQVWIYFRRKLAPIFPFKAKGS